MPDIYKNNWIKGKEDPDLYVKIYCSTPTRNYSLIPHQSFFLKEFMSGKFDELWFSAGNSAGKTWSAKFLAEWASPYKLKPGRNWKSFEEYMDTPYSILCTGPEQKQAIELWEKIEEGFKQSPFLRHKVSNITIGSRRNTHPQIVLKNGTTIEAVGLHEKGKHVEGEAYDIILINEPADVRNLTHIMEKVLTPRTWRRGGIIAGFGTPKGKGDFWLLARRGISDKDFNLYYGGTNSFKEPRVFTMFGDSRDNPFANQEKIARYTDSKNEDLIKERIKGLFMDAASLAFPDNHIEKNIDDTLQLPIKASSGHQYLHGLDFGRKEDYTVCITADVSTTPYTIVNFYRKGGGVATWEEIMGDIQRISQDYGGDFVVDATASSGDMQLEWLSELQVNYYPYQFGGSPAKKVSIINNLQDFLAKGFFRMPFISQLREELHGYPRDLNDKGLETDTVMALALLAHGIKNYGPIGFAEPYKR